MTPAGDGQHLVSGIDLLTAWPSTLPATCTSGNLGNTVSRVTPAGAVSTFATGSVVSAGLSGLRCAAGNLYVGGLIDTINPVSDEVFKVTRP